MLEWFSSLNYVIQALIATIFTWTVTALGASIVFLFKKINKSIMDAMLGFAAGVMISASFWSLLSPSIEMSKTLNLNPWLIASIGFILGGLLLFVGDKIFDRLEKNKNKNEKNKMKRCMMLIFSITLHNIPEGLAVGVAFGSIAYGLVGATESAAIMLALGIGIQNFPEGAAVSLPLRTEGYSRSKSFMIGQASALVEPISAVIGAILVIYIRSVLPFLLAFAAGAMITVVARELLPESVNGNKNLSTLGMSFGFVLMMILDVALG